MPEHDAIISPEDWEKAQIKLAAQAKKYEKVNKAKDTRTHLLSGIVKCPVCGAGMVGYRDADDVVYLADCLSSAETLEKYQIGFVYDVAAYLDTLETVKNLTARQFVPAHAPAAEQIAPLAQQNIDKVHEIAERITALCREPLCFEQLLQKLFEAYDLSMAPLSTFWRSLLICSNSGS